MVAILPPFLDYQFIVAGVDNLDRNYYAHFERNNVRILFNETFDLTAPIPIAKRMGYSDSQKVEITKGSATYRRYRRQELEDKGKDGRAVPSLSHQSQLSEQCCEQYREQYSLSPSPSHVPWAPI